MGFAKAASSKVKGIPDVPTILIGHCVWQRCSHSESMCHVHHHMWCWGLYLHVQCASYARACGMDGTVREGAMWVSLSNWATESL